MVMIHLPVGGQPTVANMNGDAVKEHTILLLHTGDLPNEVCAVLILVEAILDKQKDIGAALGDVLSLDRVILCSLGREPL